MPYTIAESSGRFRTGTLPSGGQVLFGVVIPDILVYRFDKDGQLLGRQAIPLEHPPAWNPFTNSYDLDRNYAEKAEAQIAALGASLDVRAGPITVGQFSDPDKGVGIQELPSEFMEAFVAPDNFTPDEQGQMTSNAETWRRSGRYVLNWVEELWVSQDGRIVSS